MSPADRKAASERAVQKLLNNERFAQARQIFCYVSMPEEVDTHGLIRRCLTDGKSVAVPRVAVKAGAIEARRIECWEGMFVPGPFGILEPNPAVAPLMDPKRIDCVIVPGLAFDPEGYRLGRGKGYYDRFLAAMGPRAARLALAFECQRVDKVPHDEHDERVHLVLYG